MGIRIEVGLLVHRGMSVDHGMSVASLAATSQAGGSLFALQLCVPVNRLCSPSQAVTAAGCLAGWCILDSLQA